MTLARGTVNAEQADGPELSRPLGHQQSTLLDSEIHLPMSEQEEDEDHAREVASWKTLPWWKRPSPYWLIFGTFFSSIGSAALLAPKVAMYTALACRVHRQENAINANVADAPVPYIFDDIPPVLLPSSAHTSSAGYTEDGSDPGQKCASDPVVQAVVARLNAVFTTSTGILSCLTASWWGSLSDRYGRRIVLFVSVFGLFVTEITHIITAWFVDVLPGGYWFPLVGFLIEGLCGGMSSGVAMAHAYLADTTDASTRSRYFSLFLGLMFTGVAIGPALGGLFIRLTGTILSIFYFSTILVGIYSIFILLIFPESLTRARARGARLRRRQEEANQASSGRPLSVVKNIARSFKPLAVLLPEQSLERRDWNLFFLAIAYALITNAMGVLSYKVQYAAAQFNWTPDIMSFYVSSIGVTRAIFLTLVLPLIIKRCKTAPIQLPSTPNEPLRGTVSPSRSSAQTNPPKQLLPASGSSAFDLVLVRVSAGLEATAFLGMAVASTGSLFTLASMMTSLTAGFSPAAQALALDIYTNRRSRDRGEIGKLFGALSVLQALGSQIINPALYGFVYSNTVAVFPQAIMIVSMCTSSFALISLSFVRVPSKVDCMAARDGNEQGGQDTAAP